MLASCSNFSRDGNSSKSDSTNTSDTSIHNIALTLYTSKTRLESFSNFISSSSSSITTSTLQDYSTTSISFGGSNAKSRYVCVSDSGGYISVWDMKKQPVKRVRHFRLSSYNTRNGNLNLSCSKACIDPTNTFVIGLHNGLGMSSSSLSMNNNNQHVTLDLFH